MDGWMEKISFLIKNIGQHFQDSKDGQNLMRTAFPGKIQLVSYFGL